MNVECYNLYRIVLIILASTYSYMVSTMNDLFRIKSLENSCVDPYQVSFRDYGTFDGYRKATY